MCKKPFWVSRKAIAKQDKENRISIDDSETLPLGPDLTKSLLLLVTISGMIYLKSSILDFLHSKLPPVSNIISDSQLLYTFALYQQHITF